MIDGNTMFQLVSLILVIFAGIGTGMYFALSQKIKTNTQQEATKISKHYTSIAYMGIGDNYRSQYEKMVDVIPFSTGNELAKNITIKKRFLEKSIESFDIGIRYCEKYRDPEILLTKYELMYHQIKNYTTDSCKDIDVYQRLSQTYKKEIDNDSSILSLEIKKQWDEELKKVNVPNPS